MNTIIKNKNNLKVYIESNLIFKYLNNSNNSINLSSNVYIVTFKIDQQLCNSNNELKWDHLNLLLEVISSKLLYYRYKYTRLMNVENKIKLNKPIQINSLLYIKCEIKEYQDILIYTNIDIKINSMFGESILNSTHSYFIKNGFHINNSKQQIQKQQHNNNILYTQQSTIQVEHDNKIKKKNDIILKYLKDKIKL